jgi:hypothetical protein
MSCPDFGACPAVILPKNRSAWHDRCFIFKPSMEFTTKTLNDLKQPTEKPKTFKIEI